MWCVLFYNIMERHIVQPIYIDHADLPSELDTKDSHSLYVNLLMKWLEIMWMVEKIEIVSGPYGSNHKKSELFYLRKLNSLSYVDNG